MPMYVIGNENIKLIKTSINKTGTTKHIILEKIKLPINNNYIEMTLFSMGFFLWLSKPYVKIKSPFLKKNNEALWDKQI